MSHEQIEIAFVEGPAPLNGSLKRRVVLRVDGQDVDVVSLRLDSAEARCRQGNRWAKRLGFSEPEKEILEAKLATAAHRALVENQEQVDAAIDEEMIPDASSEKEGRGPSQATLLVEIAQSADLFHTPGGYDAAAFASIDVDGHREVWPVRSKGFKQWLAREYHRQHGKAPCSQGKQDAIETICGLAVFDGPEHPVPIRVANYDGAIWIDLCNDDWQAVEITSAKWRVVDSASVPVRFTRRRGMLALPAPVSGGKIEELRPFLNLPDEDAWILTKAWLCAALRPTGPYPVLNVNGPQGSAKTTFQRLLRLLIDPNEAPLRRPPRSEHDLMIAAHNAWVIAFDNMSGLPPHLSDALCVLATGGGLATRELYSDDSEKLFDAARPILLNGIDSVASRADLMDRSVHLTLLSIPEVDRRRERDLLPAFERARPRILGALLDAVSVALGRIDGVRLDSYPRMADFAAWSVAGAETLGFTPDQFLRAYRDNRAAGDRLVIDESIIGPPLEELLDRSGGTWRGTMATLGEELGEIVHEALRKTKDWPKDGAAVGRLMKRLESNLRATGIEVTKRASGSRWVHIEKVCESPSRPSNRPNTEQNADSSPETLFSPGLTLDGLDGNTEEPSKDRPTQNVDSSLETPIVGDSGRLDGLDPFSNTQSGDEGSTHTGDDVPFDYEPFGGGLAGEPATGEGETSLENSIPDGWTPSRWANRLEEMAGACQSQHPDKATEYRRQAAVIRADGGERP